MMPVLGSHALWVGITRNTSTAELNMSHRMNVTEVPIPEYFRQGKWSTYQPVNNIRNAVVKKFATGVLYMRNTLTPKM